MINVVGLGYIGLPTALMLAANGNQVIGTDCNEELINKLRKGEITFKEKEIDKLFTDAVNKGIIFSNEYQQTDVYIVSVPTPYDAKSKKVDASYIISAVKNVLASKPHKGAIIVVESTISPGTIDKFVRPVIIEDGYNIGKDIEIVHAPERIIPGNMVYELEHNSRTIGADSIEVGNKIKDVYQSFCKGKIVVTDIKTAEMTKVVENTFRDINIAYANELTKICRADNMDVYEIIKIANMHPRVNILQPGPGVGGHCISVDPWFLVGDYPGLANIILAARKINDSMPEFVLKRVYEIMQENNIIDVSKIGFYGLTYKENVDDMRESPTLQLLKNMKKHLAGNVVKIYDPMVKKDIVPNQYHEFDKFINDIEVLVIMVGHDEIKTKWNHIEEKVILDTQNVFPDKDLYHL